MSPSRFLSVRIVSGFASLLERFWKDNFYRGFCDRISFLATPRFLCSAKLQNVLCFNLMDVDWRHSMPFF